MFKPERWFFYTFPKTNFICTNRLCFKIRSNLAGFPNTQPNLALWLVDETYSGRDFYQPRVQCVWDFELPDKINETQEYNFKIHFKKIMILFWKRVS